MDVKVSNTLIWPNLIRRLDGLFYIMYIIVICIYFEFFLLVSSFNDHEAAITFRQPKNPKGNNHTSQQGGAFLSKGSQVAHFLHPTTFFLHFKHQQVSTSKERKGTKLQKI